MNTTNISVLLIEDNEADVFLIRDELFNAMGEQITLVNVDTLSGALKKIQQQSFDLILTDLHLPDSEGINTINQLIKKTDNIPIAALSYRKDEKIAIQVIKAGAQDYLVKGELTEGVLVRVIHYSIERKKAADSAKNAQQLFQTIFVKAPLGIALINLQTLNFLNVNPMYALIVGRTVDELMQISQSDILHPDDLQEFLDEMRLLYQQKIPNSKITKRMLHSNGTVIWIEMLVTAFDSVDKFNASHLCMIEDITERKQMIANLRDLTSHLQNIREEEQTRIGREIHDVLGGTLTVLKMDLDWLSKKVTVNPMHERIKSLYQLTGEAIDTARRVSKNLRPNVLDNLGLHGGIEWLVREFEQRLNIKCYFESDVSNFSSFSKKFETIIFRIIQEVFINITRHAQATVTKVMIEKSNRYIVFRIKDNGIGITEEQLLSPKSFGIISMHERANQMEAQLTITGSPSEGTMVLLRVPIENLQISAVK